MACESIDVTRMGLKAIVAVLLLAAWPAGSLHAEGERSSVVAHYPGLPWQLRYELEGVIENYNSHRPGVSTYTMARSDARNMIVSVQIHPAKEAKTAGDCRDAEHKHMREHKAFAKAQIRPLDGADVDLEVLVPLGADGAVVSRHLHRFWLRDGVCAKVHASRTPFAERDRPVFEALLASVRFEPATAAVERAFLIPDRGTLLMSVPALWGFRTSAPAPAAPRDVTFMEPAGDYQLMLSFFPDSEKILKGDPTTRTFVEMARNALKPKSLEPDPPLLPIKGTGGEGFYFLVTDKELVGKPDRPNDWKHMRQGALRIAQTLLIFSLLSNAKESPAADDALRAIREARLLPPR